MTTSVIVAGARTPMGRLLGSLKGFSAADLGGFAIKAALERSGVSPEQVDSLSLDGRSDQWSLGVVLWEMVAGRRLFRVWPDRSTRMSI